MSDERHTILVVDDDENNRDLIARRLRRAGYRVVTAGDGREALARLRQPGIDLVVLDVMMPGLSGIDVLKKIRQTRPASELPIIMATARDQSEDQVAALDHGADDYVTKPLDFPVALARIQAQLRRVAPPRHRGDDADCVGLLGALRPGMVLGGKYRLESELGAGNFGVVYRASHLGLEQPVAVKILQASVADSPAALARFQQEGRSAFRLQHPNAVSVLDFAVTPAGLAYLVMELLEGRTLDQELKKRGRLPVERAAAIVLPVCAVLHEAHALGIIHRDVKPTNVFLHRARRREVVKVLDFGIAKLVGDSAVSQSLTIEEGLLGTPAYMAPERLWGKPYDGRADAYSVGITLYQMLAGRPPFVAEHHEAVTVAIMHVTHEPEPLAAWRPDAPPELASAVMAMLAKEPARRPTVAELARALARILALDLPPALRREPAAELVGGDAQRAFAFEELLAPPAEDASARRTALPALRPSAAVNELWTRLY